MPTLYGRYVPWTTDALEAIETAAGEVIVVWDALAAAQRVAAAVLALQRVGPEAFAAALGGVTAPGLALPSDDPASNWGNLLAALAVEWSRLRGRAVDLLGEALPYLTTELLADWETVAGLPDPCTGEADPGADGRRRALVTRITARGGQSIAYLADLAATLGYAITIEEFRPFRAGRSGAGDAINGGPWPFTFVVHAPTATVTSMFRAGLSVAGDPITYAANLPLECLINRARPAHTAALFSYGS